ncbi:dTDP-glucose 4,6-dehydratase-like [Stegodyphus dumicola]|uniref:dTDP-glucose 4,6-dehydratase-like n=1 Tax=Stegodyphus dumicola TaxID=202533 RepID=UPI0015AFE005|nr:dTDP-glucose 4,6-dehydratase-like [Stegodyphus dumicola]
MANSEQDAASKYRVLILGGCGFIGRHLVDYLISNNLVSKVRVVDKVPPQTAWLNKHHQEVFSSPLVEFKSANLINSTSCQNAFIDEEGSYDFVVNLAAETKMGQSDPVYKEGIVKLSINCAKEAVKNKVSRFIEISSGHVHSSEKTPIKESAKPDPWTVMARFKLQVEEELPTVSGLDYVVLRPAIVYGVGDKHGLMPRLVVGAVYKHLGEMMKLLWHKDIKMNTVHVCDMSRAIWHACLHGKSGEIYHIVDKGDTTQGKISDIVSDIFNINHDYFGTTMSTLAKVDMSTLVDDINDKHLGPWAEACSKDGIENTPLNPYLHQELLYDKHLNLDGSKFEATGFTYMVPNLTKEKVQEVVNDYIAMRIFPRSLVV